MDTYADLISLKNQGMLLERLAPIDAPSIIRLKEAYPGLPDDYTRFLENFGCGELGEEAYMLYCGLRDPATVYGQDAAMKANVLLLGDDFLGYCNGFVLHDWSVVEIDPTNLQPIKVADSFSDFIRAKIEWAGQ